MFTLGINTGLRISDILSIKVGDVVDPTFRRLPHQREDLIVEKDQEDPDVLLNDSARHALKIPGIVRSQYKEHFPCFRLGSAAAGCPSRGSAHGHF